MRSQNPLQNYQIIQSFSTHLLLQDNISKSKAVYKEFKLPEFLTVEQLNEMLEIRRQVLVPNLIQIHMVLLDQADSSTNSQFQSNSKQVQKFKKFGLLYEAPLIDFQQEILKRIAANCPWTEEEIFNTLELVLEGLKSLHNNGLVHGDLRAKNVVFCEDKNIKIADQFAFSTQFIKQIDDIIKDQNSLLAPEVIKSKQYSIEGDLWSLGMLFLEASSLQRSKDFYRWKDSGEEPEVDFDLIWDRLQNLSQSYSENFISILTSLLNEEPSKRFQIFQILENFYQQQQQIQLHLQQAQMDQIPEITDESELERTNIQFDFQKENQQQKYSSQQESVNNTQDEKDIQKVIENLKIHQNSFSVDQEYNLPIDTTLNFKNDFGSKREVVRDPSFSNLNFTSKSNNSNLNCSLEKYNQRSPEKNQFFGQNDFQNQEKESELNLSEIIQKSQTKKESSILQEKQKNLNNLIDDCLNKSKMIIQKSSLKNNPVQKENEVQTTEISNLQTKSTLNEKFQNSIQRTQQILHKTEQKETPKLNKKTTASQIQKTSILYPDGTNYEGQVNEEKIKEGFGTLFNQNQEIIYQGEWKNDKFHGIGVLFNQNIKENYDQDFICFRNLKKFDDFWIKYHGDFQEGKKYGIGVIQFMNGETFHGQFENDIIQGRGTYKSNQNELTHGEWKNNAIVCQKSL